MDGDYISEAPEPERLFVVCCCCAESRPVASLRARRGGDLTCGGVASFRFRNATLPLFVLRVRAMTSPLPRTRRPAPPDGSPSSL